MTEKNTNQSTPVINLKYTCSAYPPMGVELDRVYLFGKDKQGFYYESTTNKFYAELWFIKMLFSPIDKKWDELDRTISGL